MIKCIVIIGQQGGGGARNVAVGVAWSAVVELNGRSSRSTDVYIFSFGQSVSLLKSTTSPTNARR